MAAKHQQLPQEISQSTTKSKILLSLLIPWIVFAFANLAANLYLNYFPENQGYWLIRKKWQMLLNLPTPVDLLVLGDSSCNQGVIPKVLKSELDISAVNLCTIGDTLVLNDAWMLSKYIKKYGAPKNVLIVHVYDIWNRDLNWNYTSQIPLFWGYWHKLEPKIKVNFQDQKTIFLNKHIPLYSQDKSLKNIIHHPDNWFTKKPYSIYPDGFMAVVDSNTAEVEADTQRHLKSIKNKQFELSTPNRKSLEAILKLAEKHDFNVFLSNSPIYEELYNNPDFQVYFQQVKQKLTEFSDRSPKLHYIMSEPMTFSKQEMDNVDHLIESAAKLYTKKLASELRNQKI